ncbi:MAG TPA: hypothetical protein PK014_06710 [Thermoanaerobaculia bacterium]|nr:hypothetical protein [Thermoanaerobaculia bacterium]HUM29870.1 hypothetical protein [Thermoanaerobaculia bacterium]HXK68145.1 hypothetical protein [Thermoanaerobaculia bacterium]
MRSLIAFILLSLTALPAFSDCCDDLVNQLVEIKIYSQDNYALKEMLNNKIRLFEAATTTRDKEVYGLTILYLKLKLDMATREDFAPLKFDTACTMIAKPLIALTYTDAMTDAGLDPAPETIAATMESNMGSIRECYYQLHTLCRVQNVLRAEERNPACNDADAVFMTQDQFSFRLHKEFRKFLTTELRIKPKTNIKLDLVTEDNNSKANEDFQKFRDQKKKKARPEQDQDQ